MLPDEFVLTPLPGNLREERLRLGCAVHVAHSQQCVSSDLKSTLLARFVIGAVERDGKPKQKVGALGVIRPERECVVVLGRRDRVAVEGGRSVSGGAQRQAGALDDLVVAATRCTDELERRAPVVREHLGVVIRTAEAVDPFRDGTVPLRAVVTWDLAVRDVAHERVRKRKLALPFE